MGRLLRAFNWGFGKRALIELRFTLRRLRVKKKKKNHAQHYSQNRKISLKTLKKNMKVGKLDVGSVKLNTLFSANEAVLVSSEKSFPLSSDLSPPSLPPLHSSPLLSKPTLSSMGLSLTRDESRRPLHIKYHADIHISSSLTRCSQFFTK